MNISDAISTLEKIRQTYERRRAQKLFRLKREGGFDPYRDELDLGRPIAETKSLKRPLIGGGIHRTARRRK